jgi:hypothetical protein
MKKSYSQRLEQRPGFIEFVVEKQVDGMLCLVDRGLQFEIIREPNIRKK